jgi:hypothetical protein
MPIVLALIGAFAGGIVSGFPVHSLTRSREHEAWIRNCVKEEWKELFTQHGKMEHAAIGLAVAYRSGKPDSIAKELMLALDQENELHVILHSRMFIQGHLEESHLMRQWWNTNSEYLQIVKGRSINEEELSALGRDFDRIHTDMRALMLRELTPQRQWRRLKFWKD